jgi:PIN domain nuclease of toxin-antitoxin system
MGLSLGDRACIALAMELGATAMTCDRAWTSLDPLMISGARIDMLR